MNNNQIKQGLTSKIDKLIEYRAKVDEQLQLQEKEMQKVSKKYKIPVNEDFQVDIKEYNRKRHRKRKFFKRVREWWLDKKQLHKIVLVNMELKNGFHTSMVVKESGNGFKWMKGTYIFDSSLKYYDLSAKLWCYDYHEEMACPVKRTVPVKDIRETLESGGITDISYAINPKSLERFQKSKMIEQILTAGDLADWLKQMKMVAVVIAIIVVVTLVIVIYSSGIISGVGGVI